MIDRRFATISLNFGLQLPRELKIIQKGRNFCDALSVVGSSIIFNDKNQSARVSLQSGRYIQNCWKTLKFFSPANREQRLIILLSPSMAKTQAHAAVADISKISEALEYFSPVRVRLKNFSNCLPLSSEKRAFTNNLLN